LAVSELLRIEDLRTYFDTDRGTVKAVDAGSLAVGARPPVGAAEFGLDRFEES